MVKVKEFKKNTMRTSRGNNGEGDGFDIGTTMSRTISNGGVQKRQHIPQRSIFGNSVGAGDSTKPKIIVVNKNAKDLKMKSIHTIYNETVKRSSQGVKTKNEKGNADNKTTTATVQSKNEQPRIVLLCETNYRPLQKRTLLLDPNVECKVGRAVGHLKAEDSNAFFDCDVLSRNHAVVWCTDDGKFWVKDTDSSNGTYINDIKLGKDGAELHNGDRIRFGFDVNEDDEDISHGCVKAIVKVYYPGSILQNNIESDKTVLQRPDISSLHFNMQQSAKRAEDIKTKLTGLKTVLASANADSALCWNRTIQEDMLIQHISTLEKKIKVFDSQMSETDLRNEILKLIEEKNNYQTTAKEALRKIYQERCDALQNLAKLELAYAESENRCKMFREEICLTQKSMQEIHDRLTKLEEEYKKHKSIIVRNEATAYEIQTLQEELRIRDDICNQLQREVWYLQEVISLENMERQMNEKNLERSNTDLDPQGDKQESVENKIQMINGNNGNADDFNSSDCIEKSSHDLDVCDKDREEVSGFSRNDLPSY